MKKIFAKELAALAVLALAFTGCNTAFDGTNANFSEKESEYTEISGATNKIPDTDKNKLGDITCTINGSIDGTIAKNNNKNVIEVTITSFSKIDLESADKAIHFQQLKNNPTSGYYPIRGADLPKTRIDVYEPTGSGTVTTTITYEVNGTGVTTNKVALFVDAKELKTKGGSAVLALDKNTIRGEESDSFIKYLDADGETAIVCEGAGGVDENFCPTYSPIVNMYSEELKDASGKLTGVYRFAIMAKNKNEEHPNDATEKWESELAVKLNDAVVIQYRKPGSRTYEEKKLTWTYHDVASTRPTTDPYSAHSYTADTTFDEIGTVWRACITYVDGLDAPEWFKDVYGHPAIVYSAGNGVGAKGSFASGTYTLHKTVPSYIVVNATAATFGSDLTSNYNPTLYGKTEIKTAQSSYFNSVTIADNWFQVSTVAGVELDPNAAKDFIVVDANNKKIAADVDVITFSYNDSTATSGKVNYVKITLKDVRYRNYSGFASADKTLKVLVGSGTKIMENKTYPSQLTFGQWKDVADDDASGYVQIYPTN